MFTQRPDDPAEWAGLPSEPLAPRSLADQLPDAPPISLLGESGVSISLTVPRPDTDETDG